MLTAAMTAPRTRKPAATKPTPRAKAPAKPKRRKASLYARTGEEGRRAAQRALLLASLNEHGWKFPAVAKALGLARSAGVSHALADVAPDEYAAAKKDGRIKQGAPRG